MTSNKMSLRLGQELHITVTQQTAMLMKLSVSEIAEILDDLVAILHRAGHREVERTLRRSQWSRLVSGIETTRKDRKTEIKVDFTKDEIAEYDSDLIRRVQRATGTLKANARVRRFLKEVAWIIHARQKVATYIAQKQHKYLVTQNPMEIEALQMQEVAGVVGYHASTVSRLVRNLAFRAGGGSVVAAKQLLASSGRLDRIKINSVLDNLKARPEYYDRGWKVTRDVLCAAVNRAAGIRASPRTISKYIRNRGELQTLTPSSQSPLIWRILDQLKARPEYYDRGWKVTAPILRSEIIAAGIRVSPSEMEEHLRARGEIHVKR